MPEATISFPLGLTFLDYPDNESQAVIVFVHGCIHNCRGCHNPEMQKTHMKESGTIRATSEMAAEAISSLAERNKTDKVVLSGGDPLFYDNVCFTIDLLKILSERGMKIALYTGCTHSEVGLFGIEGYEFVKCNPYEREAAQPQIKDDHRMTLASRNQKIYDRNGKLLTKDGVLTFS